MCCVTLTALPFMMTTTEFLPRVREVNAPWLPKNVDGKPVRMNWVVASNGCEQGKLRMQWNIARDKK